MNAAFSTNFSFGFSPQRLNIAQAPSTPASCCRTQGAASRGTAVRGRLRPARGPGLASRRRGLAQREGLVGEGARLSGQTGVVYGTAPAPAPAVAACGRARQRLALRSRSPYKGWGGRQRPAFLPPAAAAEEERRCGVPSTVSPLPPHLFKIFILPPPQLWGAAAARRVRRGKMARSGARPPRLLMLLLLTLVLPAAAERSPGPGPAGEARSGTGGRAPGCAAQAGSCRGYGLIA